MPVEQCPGRSCAICGAPMNLARSLPKFGPHPELATYACRECRNVETEAVEPKR